MSADGEIEVAVRAEGVDDASEELADGDGGGVGGGGDGDGGLTGRLGRGGIIAGVLLTLLGLLEPISQFLNAIFKVLQAFLAPIALIIVRLLTPFLRFFVRLLPAWFDLINSIMPLVDDATKRISRKLLLVELVARLIYQKALQAVDYLQNLPTKLRELGQKIRTKVEKKISQLIKKAKQFIANMREKLAQKFEQVKSKLQSLPQRIWNKIKELSSMIGDEIASRIPNIGLNGDGGSIEDRARDAINRGRDAIENKTNVVLSGGLSAFVESVERSADVDIQQ